MNRDERVTEVWFAGAHSDVGGGYRYDGLSDNALQFMIDFIEQDRDLGLEFRPPGAIEYSELFEGARDLIDYEEQGSEVNKLARLIAEIHYEQENKYAI